MLLEHPHVLGYLRTIGQQSLAVFLNFSSAEKTVEVPASAQELLFSTRTDPGTLFGRQYVLRPYEAIVTTQRNT
jgi:hypothetical protein